MFSRSQVPSPSILKKENSSKKIGHDQGRSVGEVLDDAINFQDTKDGENDASVKISNANTAGGNSIRLNAEEFETSTEIQMTRYSAITSSDKQPWSKTILKWVGAINSTIFSTESNQNIEGITFNGNSISGVVGTLIGNATKYLAYLTFKRNVIKNCDIGLKIDNVFDTRIEQARIHSNRVGVSIEPTNFGSDGGYTTTLHFDRCYITDNTEEGIIDRASIKNKMLSISHSVIEKNGDASHPQIKLLEGQPNSIYNCYIEDATDTVTAVEMPNGSIENCYINGFAVGIDLGSGSSAIIATNVKFASGGGASMTSSGGSNAKFAGMRRCEFSGMPTLDSQIQIYDGCSGDMPYSLPDFGWYMVGSSPKFGVGTTPAITRDIEAWLESDAGTTVAANSVYRFNVSIPVGRMADGKTALSITPQSDLAVGLSATVARVSTTVARVTITNPTSSGIVLSATDYLMRMEQYNEINS